MRQLHPAVAYNRLLVKARLRHLQLLVALVDRGTISGAAQSLGISQPAATQLLLDLEALMEARLFDRHSRGVRPTAFCGSLIPVLGICLRSVELAIQSAPGNGDESLQLMRVGCIPSAAAGAVAHGVIDALRFRPNLEVLLLEGSMSELLSELLAARLDVVFGRPPCSTLSGLTFIPLLDDVPRVFACRSHPLFGSTIDDFRDLAVFPWIFHHGDADFDRYVSELWLGFWPQPVSERIWTNSIQFLSSIMRDSRRICLAPHSVAATICMSGEFGMLDVALFGLSIDDLLTEG